MALKYKIGDKVRIKSLDWYNANKDANGDVLCFYGVHKFTKEMSKFCAKTVTISTNLTGDGEYLIKEDDETNWWTDEMIEGLVEPIDCKKCGLTRNSTRCLFMDNCPHNQPKNTIEIPEGWVIKDENGNVINATKIVLEKKKTEYPKTYAECCDVLRIPPLKNDVEGYKWELLVRFQEILIARDAYWKIAGEEMGLNRPWEPDWNIRGYYAIARSYGNVVKTSNYNCDLTFVFPTEEMRDTFYENFKELIEQCKELL